MHTNITFIKDGLPVQTYGANVSPMSGAQNETDATMQRIANEPWAHTFTDITVSDEAFFNALAFAQSSAANPSPYQLFCGNCVDFADRTLVNAGFSSFSISDFLTDGSVLDAYARASRLLCTSPREVAMYSLAGFDTFSELSIFDDLRDDFGPASWDDYIDRFHHEWLDNGGSPIAIDLNGDGLRTTSLAGSDVRFDVTGDGVAERTAWLDSSDGFVVRDLNGNGKIDDVGEMFGGMARGVGYAELSTLDSNGDGAISNQDKEFGSLQIWRDANSDGITQTDELHTLAAFGIETLGLDYASTQVVDHGNLIGEMSWAAGDGIQRTMGDIYFQYDRGGVASVAPDAGLNVQGLVQAMAAFGATSAIATTAPLFESNAKVEASLACYA